MTYGYLLFFNGFVDAIGLVWNGMPLLGEAGNDELMGEIHPQSPETGLRGCDYLEICAEGG